MIVIKNVSKQFPGVFALDGVSFDVMRGHAHGLVGENGAGKSTIVKILSGVYQDFDGEIIIDGKLIAFRSVLDARDSGIATVFQELSVAKDLSVAENIFLGREPTNKLGVVNQALVRRRCEEVMAFLDEPLDIDERVGNLSVASQQIVEICKALVLNAKVIIMDEPTSSLTEKETQQLFKIINQLKQQGVTLVYVSHKLEEVLSICDRITVFRDGKHIKTVNTVDVSVDDVIQMMVGRTLGMLYPGRSTEPANEPLLTVIGAARWGEFHDVSFQLNKGEILGFAGLIGSGRTELAKAIFGATALDAGSIFLEKREQRPFSHPGQALKGGISYLSEDRKGEGLLMQASVKENMTLAILKKLRLFRIGSDKDERNMVSKYSDDLKIKMIDIDHIVELLSGGNQQKVVVGRLLLTDTAVFIFDEPTRGIDVGAKYEIYKIMNELTERGKGILFISSELPEVLGVSDRIACMCEGTIRRVYSKEEASPELVMKVLTGGAIS